MSIEVFQFLGYQDQYWCSHHKHWQLYLWHQCNLNIIQANKIFLWINRHMHFLFKYSLCILQCLLPVVAIFWNPEANFWLICSYCSHIHSFGDHYHLIGVIRNGVFCTFMFFISKGSRKTYYNWVSFNSVFALIHQEFSWEGVILQLAATQNLSCLLTVELHATWFKVQNCGSNDSSYLLLFKWVTNGIVFWFFNFSKFCEVRSSIVFILQGSFAPPSLRFFLIF